MKFNYVCGYYFLLDLWEVTPSLNKALSLMNYRSIILSQDTKIEVEEMTMNEQQAASPRELDPGAFEVCKD